MAKSWFGFLAAVTFLVGCNAVQTSSVAYSVAGWDRLEGNYHILALFVQPVKSVRPGLAYCNASPGGTVTTSVTGGVTTRTEDWREWLVVCQMKPMREALNPDWAKAQKLKEEEDKLFREYGLQIVACGIYGDSYASFCKRARQIGEERSRLNMEEKTPTEKDLKELLKLRATAGTPSK